jgi:hypothetical protein
VGLLFSPDFFLDKRRRIAKMNTPTFLNDNVGVFVLGRMTKIVSFLAGQSGRSALNSWAAQQRRPTGRCEGLGPVVLMGRRSICGAVFAA